MIQNTVGAFSLPWCLLSFVLCPVSFVAPGRAGETCTLQLVTVSWALKRVSLPDASRGWCRGWGCSSNSNLNVIGVVLLRQLGDSVRICFFRRAAYLCPEWHDHAADSSWIYGLKDTISARCIRNCIFGAFWCICGHSSKAMSKRQLQAFSAQAGADSCRPRRDERCTTVTLGWARESKVQMQRKSMAGYTTDPLPFWIPDSRSRESYIRCRSMGCICCAEYRYWTDSLHFFCSFYLFHLSSHLDTPAVHLVPMGSASGCVTGTFVGKTDIFRRYDQWWWINLHREHIQIQIKIQKQNRSKTTAEHGQIDAQH